MRHRAGDLLYECRLEVGVSVPPSVPSYLTSDGFLFRLALHTVARIGKLRKTLSRIGRRYRHSAPQQRRQP